MKQKKYKRDKDLLSEQYNKFSYPNPIDDIENALIDFSFHPFIK